MRSDEPGRRVAPVVFPLASRWATWLLGVGILVLGGGSERSQMLRVPLVLGTLLALAIVSALAWRLFDRGWPIRPREVALLTAGDVALSLLVIWIEGGWSSAFYELAMTSVMLPSLAFGGLGAICSAAGFSLGFLVILMTSEMRPSADGSLSLQVASLLNPWIVGGVVAVIADLLHRLERALARNLELAASEERWRIAREIHDGVAQQSYALTLGLETAVELARREDLAGLQQRLPPLEKLSRQALLEVRQYVTEGRPLILGEQTLVAALEGLGREFSSVTGITIEIRASDEHLDLPANQQNAIYRLTQESLANVFKHAEATIAVVTLRNAPEGIELEIRDNGQGIDLSQRHRGFGLRGMQRRVEELNGSFSVAAGEDGGTVVQTKLPR